MSYIPFVLYQFLLYRLMRSGVNKLAAILQTTIQMHGLKLKKCILMKISLICYHESNWQ